MWRVRLKTKLIELRSCLGLSEFPSNTFMPYWRLSFIYFCYFAVVGSLSPYWSLYLLSLGFSIKEIGFIVALPLVTKLISPYIWGWLADKSQKPIAIMIVGALGTCVFFSSLIYFKAYWPIVIFVFLYSFFWNAILPQFEVVTLQYLGDHPHFYSRVRVWGSIGFIVLVLSLGVLFDHFSLNLLPLIVLVFMLMIFLNILCLPKASHSNHTESSKIFWLTFKNSKIYLFFIILFLLQFSHGVYYAFFSIYLDDLSYSKSAIAFFWMVGVLAEIIAFVKMPSLFKRYSLNELLLTTLLLTALRWFFLANFAEIPALLFCTQLIHAFSFGVAHAVAIEFVRTNFSKGQQGQGQALYSAVCFGGGTALGIFVSSRIWEHNHKMAFGVSVMAVLLGACFCVFLIRKNSFVIDEKKL